MFIFGFIVGSTLTVYGFTYGRVNPAIIAKVTSIKEMIAKAREKRKDA